MRSIESRPLPVPSVESVRIDAMATGGDAIARLANGQIVFIPGGLPSEQVQIQVQRGRDFARGTLLKVEVSSPDRIAPPCPAVAAGCGGCSWQHIRPGAQRELKRSIVVDALRRIGKLSDAESLVRHGPQLTDNGYRTTVRLAVGADGRAGFRAHGSREVVPLPEQGCLVAAPALSEAMRSIEATLATWPSSAASSGQEIQIRASLATGAIEVTTVHRGGSAGHRQIRFVNAADRSRGALVEVVSGVGLRISRDSFFQARPDGAEALVALVAAGFAGHIDPSTTTFVDLYGGVGLFAATTGRQAARVVLVEGAESAVADASRNLEPRIRGRTATVVRCDVNDWRPTSSELGPDVVVVADPARAGLGRGGVAAIKACRPKRLVLVSCDAAALARDTMLLHAASLELRTATVVDLFPHTAHIEVVSVFDPILRPSPRPRPTTEEVIGNLSG